MLQYVCDHCGKAMKCIVVKSAASTNYIPYTKSVEWFIEEYLDDDHRQVLFIEGIGISPDRMFIGNEIDYVPTDILNRLVKDFEYCFNPETKKTWLLLKEV